jgi:hypothetical protein
MKGNTVKVCSTSAHSMRRVIESLERRQLLVASDFFSARDLRTTGTSAVIADFNEDGTPDIAANQSVQLVRSILVTIGSGGGRYLPGVTYPVTSGATDFGEISSGDFDRDGHTDLVATSYSGVYVFPGNGDGTFLPARFTAINSQNQYVDIAVGDLNGDQRPDVVTSSSTFGTIAVSLNNGSGTLLPPTYYPAASFPDDVALADISGDGALDAIVANNGSDNVTIHVGNGNGTFQAATPVSMGSGTKPHVVAVRDLNGDSRLDVVVGTYLGGSITVRLNNGNGIYSNAATYSMYVNQEDFSLGDVNADGFVDCAAVNLTTGNIAFRLGAANGTFGSLVTYSAGPANSYVRISDIDGDSKPDLLLGCGTFLKGTGDGSFVSSFSLAAGQFPYKVISPDLNGDSFADLVVADRSAGTVEVRLAPATISPGSYFGSATTFTMGAGASDVIAFDLDSDGKLDLATANTNVGTVTVRRGLGNGSFGAAATYSVGTGTGPNQIVGGDFDHDGDIDLATNNSFTHTVSVLSNAGNATFAAAITLGAAITSGYGISTADVDGDGFTDLLRADGSVGRILVYPGTASGLSATFTAVTINDTPYQPTVGDFDHDGQSELLVSGYSGYRRASNTSVPGSIHFGSFALVLGSNNAPSTTAFVDIDGDGLMDLVGDVGQNLVVNYGNADHTYIDTANYVAAGAIRSLVVVDFNRDGKPDVVVVDSSGRSLRLLSNNGPADRTAPTIASIEFDPTIAMNVIVNFSEPLVAAAISRDDLDFSLITGQGSGFRIPATSVALSADRRSATFEFDPRLSDGNFRVRIQANSVIDENGNPIADNPYVTNSNWFVLAGDINRDRHVDFDDLVILAQNYGLAGRTFSQGNLNYDANGNVDFADLVILAQRYNASLPAAPAAVSVAPAKSITKRSGKAFLA